MSDSAFRPLGLTRLFVKFSMLAVDRVELCHHEL
jgi:hypothetical protein